MSKLVFDYDTAIAAMALFEELIDPVSAAVGAPWKDYRDQWGTAALRDTVLTKLAAPAMADYNRAWEIYEAKHPDDPTKGQEPGAFDYEYAPTWLRTAIDWSDVDKGPRVLGSRHK